MRQLISTYREKKEEEEEEEAEEESAGGERMVEKYTKILASEEKAITPTTSQLKV